jgi:hypothetical protein
MNQTELFLITMGLTYAQMVLATNKTLPAAQVAALQAFVAAGEGVSAAFTTSPAVA